MLANPWVLALLFYGVGAAGMLSPWKLWFQFLTPFLLLASVLALLLTTGHTGRAKWLWALGVALAGYFAEVVGVQTGVLFGEYRYDWVLGPQVLGVPVVIGVNWLILTYITAHITRALPLHWLPGAALAAAMMVGLDVLIEPVAIAYEMWHWADAQPPLQNYIGWFLIALPIQLATHRLPFVLDSRWAKPLLVANLLFFIALNLF